MLSGLLIACNPASDFPDTPILGFKSMSKNVMNQGSVNNDSILVILSFSDGDGDITITDNSQNKLNLIVRDSRTGLDYGKFKIPEIPESGANNGISGDIQILLFNACCIFPPQDSIPACSAPPQHPDNELIWEFELRDNAGNISNTVMSPVVQLICI